MDTVYVVVLIKKKRNRCFNCAQKSRDRKWNISTPFKNHGICTCPVPLLQHHNFLDKKYVFVYYDDDDGTYIMSHTSCCANILISTWHKSTWLLWSLTSLLTSVWFCITESQPLFIDKEKAQIKYTVIYSIFILWRF